MTRCVERGEIRKAKLCLEYEHSRQGFARLLNFLANPLGPFSSLDT